LGQHQQVSIERTGSLLLLRNGVCVRMNPVENIFLQLCKCPATATPPRPSSFYQFPVPTCSERHILRPLRVFLEAVARCKGGYPHASDLAFW
jgi:hypothetical protein